MLMTHYREPIDFSVARLEEALSAWKSFAGLVRDSVFAPETDAHFVSALLDDLNTPVAIQRLHALRRLAAAGDVDSGRRLLGSLRLIGLFTAGFTLRMTINYPDVDLSRVNADAFVSANTNLSADVPIAVVAERVGSTHPDDGKYIVDTLHSFGKGSTWGDALALCGSLGLDSVREAVDSRLAALNAKDFAAADRIRAELLEQGIQLKDSKNTAGERVTNWEVKR
jgi:cysteinyl-tRNA synthetase